MKKRYICANDLGERLIGRRHEYAQMLYDKFLDGDKKGLYVWPETARNEFLLHIQCIDSVLFDINDLSFETPNMESVK